MVVSEATVAAIYLHAFEIVPKTASAFEKHPKQGMPLPASVSTVWLEAIPKDKQRDRMRGHEGHA